MLFLKKSTYVSLFYFSFISIKVFADSISFRAPDFHMKILGEKIMLEFNDEEIGREYPTLLRQLTELKKNPLFNKGEQLADPLLIEKEEGGMLDITQWLNSSLRKILFRKNVQDSPNCWNGSLSFSGVTSVRYTHDDEFRFWLNSPLCREVLLSEELQIGDIGVIRTNIYESRGLNAEHHSFVYFNDDIFLERKGPGYPYEISSLVNIVQSWDLGSEHPRCLRVFGENIRNCDTYIRYFRCEPIQKYELVNSDKIVGVLQKFARRVDAFETELERFIFLPIQDDVIYNDLTEQFQSLRLELDKYFFSEGKEFPLSQIQKTFLKGLYYRLSSSLRTIIDLGSSDRVSREDRLRINNELPQWKGFLKLKD